MGSFRRILLQKAVGGEVLGQTLAAIPERPFITINTGSILNSSAQIAIIVNFTYPLRHYKDEQASLDDFQGLTATSRVLLSRPLIASPAPSKEAHRGLPTENC